MLLLLASMVLAILSWRFVETPFRKRVILKSRVQIFSFASITTAVLLLTGLTIHKWQGVPSRFPAAALRYASGTTDVAFRSGFGLKEALNGDFIELGTGDKHLPIDLLVWGDSHAMAAMPILDILCKEHLIRGVGAARYSTAPLVGYEGKNKYVKDSIAFNNAVVEFIRSKRVGDVVLVANWGGYVTADGETARIRRGLLDAISLLKDTGARIWIMRQVPEHRWYVPHALAAAVLHGHDPEELGLPLAEQREAQRLQDPIFEGLATKFPGVTVLDPTDLFVSPNNLCRMAEGGKALYCDTGHLTVAGAMVLRPLFEPIFLAIGNSAAPLERGKGVTNQN